MRPASSFTLHAILAACLAALAASSAAAGKPVNDNEGHAYLSFELLGGAKGGKGEQLEIQSWHWGPRQSTSADGFTREKPHVAPAGEYGQWIADVERPQSNAAKERQAGMKEIEAEKLDRQSGHSMLGASEKVTVGGSQTEAGRKQLGTSDLTMKRGTDPAAKPQVQYSMTGGYTHGAPPPGAGSLRVKVKMPWLSCAEGRKYPSLMLSDGATRYVLQDVVVTSCGSASAGPEEQITFVYGSLGR